MTLTAIVIDDSPMQRLATGKLVKNNPNLKLRGTFDNPKIGLQAVNLLRPDVVFLDVEMPGLNGFEVLESLEYDCQVILNSTRSQFALNAFQYNHVKDYVTKPMKKDRFEKSVDRLIKNQCAKQKTEKFNSVPVYKERLRRAS
ncbi:LytR/AlgR family response regulator transcription factor [Flagellimonas allohymeniacidonis]|uniref:Response regulator n=1 Tax=Flagellimonas allohymeniacidonis TaxID=2517819 RepID=A0A4Q8QFW8_9FLAO|nr:response regulator [Allomuricauda hymeniacidonis]TAI48098.1 response regulator [Allomuricauda hymeniacidonis]